MSMSLQREGAEPKAGAIETGAEEAPTRELQQPQVGNLLPVFLTLLGIHSSVSLKYYSFSPSSSSLSLS